MKVWKSPVFYLGVILLVAVLGSLLAPFVVDWNSYRADLEAYGRKLTGRAVTIDGPISARLFPWPRLTAEDVHLANLPGLAEKEFASASRIVVKMTLAGLISGTIQVESIDIDHPVVAFERNAVGQGNWLFQPVANPDDNDLLGRVKLDRITMRDGVARFIDRRRGGVIQLDDFNGSLAAPGIKGPWRMRSVMLHDGRSFELSLNTGNWKADEPFRFGLRLAAADNSGLAYSFDGNNDGDRVTGTIRIEPATGADGKADAEGQFRPLVLTAKLAADFDAVALDDIQISPQDTTQGGTLMSGSAKLTLGSAIAASAVLSAPRIDLDQIAGAKARDLVREGGGLAVANGLLALLPADVSLDGSLSVTSLQSGGENLENVVVNIAADHEAIRIHEIAANLPGRSRALFSGVFFPGKDGAELAGNLALESNDLRQLVSWAWPEGKDGIAKIWTGSRGRLKLETDVNLTPARLRLNHTKYEIDGVPGSADVTYAAGGRRSVDLRLDADAIDIDSFVPQGVAAMSTDSGTGLAAVLSLLLPRDDAGDLRLTVQTGRLMLNGMQADDVAIDLASSARGLDLRTLEIGSVGGARLEASGLILDTGAGSDGAIGIEIKAEDPRGLLRLLGFMPQERDPAWAAVLGKTVIKGTVNLKPGAGSTATAFDFSGTSGAFDVSASGTLTGAPALDKIEVKGSADIKSATSAALAGLVGLTPVAGDEMPGRLIVTGSGSLSGGFLADIQVQAFGARLDYNGHVNAATGLDGEASLRTTNATALFAAMGLPAATLPGGILVLDATLGGETGKPLAAQISGRLGETRLAGDLALDAGGKVSGNIETGDLVLGDVLSVVLLAWNGLPPEPETPFAAGLPLALTGEVWIKPASLRVNDNFIAKDVQIGITASAEETRIAMFGKDAGGRNAAIEIGSRADGGSRKLDGKITLPFDLGQQLRLAGGAPVASGEGLFEIGFSSAGRTPGGALAGLNGSGSYAIKNLTLLNINAGDFKRALLAATDNAGLTAAFEALRGGGGLSFGGVTGSVTVENGIAAVLPFSVKTADANASVKTFADLGQGTIDAAVTLDLLTAETLPAMEVSFAGPPLELARNEDKAALFGQLGAAIMDRGVKELERLRKEQEKFAAEDEKARLEDTAKLRAYYAQRDELRLRQRELKVHAGLRVAAAEALRQDIESARAANREINRAELKQRLRELRVYRKLAKEALLEIPVPRARPRLVKPVPEVVIEPLPLEPPQFLSPSQQ